MRKLTSLGLWKYPPLWLSGQIFLINPSFEGDEPQDATVPAGWHACKEGTTPDILSAGVWGVFTEPSEGKPLCSSPARTAPGKASASACLPL